MKYITAALISVACLVGASVAHAQFGRAIPISDKTVTNSATLIAASNPQRYILNCTNHDSTVHVRWGDGTVTSTKGQRFPALARIEIASKDAIYMISEGANVTVSCTEENR